MIYEEFIEALKLAAHKELGYKYEDMEFLQEGYTSDDPVELEEIRNANRKYLNRESDRLLTDFLIIKKPEPNGASKSHRVSTRRLYEDAEENGFDAAFNIIRQSVKDVEDANIDMSRINQRSTADYESIRDQLIIRPLNYNLHRDNLIDHVYMNVGDFVLVLYQLLGDANHSLVTSKIKMDEIKQWNMEGEIDRIMQEALENTSRIYPACVYSNKLGREVNFLTEDFTKSEITNMGQIVLSTFKVNNGAVALFYPGVVEKMMTVMGGAFLSVFMNVNDVMIIDRRQTQRAEAFANTARKSGPMGEKLSGKIYVCDEKGINPIHIVKHGKKKKKK